MAKRYRYLLKHSVEVVRDYDSRLKIHEPHKRLLLSTVGLTDRSDLALYQAYLDNICLHV